MKIEQRQALHVVIKFLIVLVFAFLYMAGGSGDFGGLKWLRRFLAPAILCLSMFAYSRDWRCLVQMPLMMGALCLPYGADTTSAKIFLRGIFGLANGTASATVCFLRRSWLIAGMQVLVVTTASIVLGAFNPTPNAMTEQFWIGAVIALAPMMMAGKKSA